MQSPVLPEPLLYGLSVILGYGLGSIPFGIVLTHLAGIDLRAVGSGNIGATNVLRTGRKDLALLTLLGDSGKGALAVLLAHLALAGQPSLELVACLAAGSAFLGHLFPVWLGFKGGKGVATFFGTLLAAAWPIGLMAGASWLLLAFLTRISSVGGMGAAVLSVAFAYGAHQPVAVIGLCAFMAALILYRHTDNLKRLLAGQEPKFGQKKTNDSETETTPKTPGSEPQ